MSAASASLPCQLCLGMLNQQEFGSMFSLTTISTFQKHFRVRRRAVESNGHLRPESKRRELNTFLSCQDRAEANLKFKIERPTLPQAGLSCHNHSQVAGRRLSASIDHFLTPAITTPHLARTLDRARFKCQTDGSIDWNTSESRFFGIRGKLVRAFDPQSIFRYELLSAT